MLSTSAPSPTTMSAPMFACRIRSSPSRRGCPGATVASASSSAGSRQVTTRIDATPVVYKRFYGLAQGGDTHHVEARRRLGRVEGQHGSHEPEPCRLEQPSPEMQHL